MLKSGLVEGILLLGFGMSVTAKDRVEEMFQLIVWKVEMRRRTLMGLRRKGAFCTFGSR
jgi:hypothetical protein